ncbi:Membrane-associated kinase regulator [Spatholobus suberectus]|nr:Membrane-associated kinase regulator [Spatholobus suberectus]
MNVQWEKKEHVALRRTDVLIRMRTSTTAKEAIRKYLKKVKHLYKKLSQKQQQQRTGELTAEGATSRGTSDTREGKAAF